MPNLYIIGGPNGSGKTTVSLRLLPNFLECFEYVNADAIAAGMSQFNPESVAILAGRLMIQRLRTLSDSLGITHSNQRNRVFTKICVSASRFGKKPGF